MTGLVRHGKDHNRFLDVQPVFRLVKDHRVGAIHDLIGYLAPRSRADSA